MIEKITIRILYYTSKTIYVLSLICLALCLLVLFGGGEDRSVRDQINVLSKILGSYWFLRILLIIVVSYIILISVEPYFDIEEKKIKQSEDEAKENNTQK